MKNKRFPIGGWVSPPPQWINGTNYITAEHYDVAAASGINIFYANYEKNAEPAVYDALKYAESANVGYMVNDFRFGNTELALSEREKLLASYKKYKSFAGINLKDEPFIEQFSQLGKAMDLNRPLFKNTLAYFNLLPIYAPAKTLSVGGDDAEGSEQQYEEYLSTFFKHIQPQVLSFDFYPFRWQDERCDDRYFLQLSMINKYAKKHNVPFWTFIQVVSWNKEIRNMSEPEVCWQVSTSLAYGAKGIQYFTYWTPIDGNGEIFDKAMVDGNGTPTKPYYFIQKLNKHLKLAGEILLDCQHIGLLSKKSNLAPIPTQDLLPCFGNIKSISSDSVITGCFKKQDKNVYYFVNDTLTEQLKFEVQFSKPISAEILIDDKICLHQNINSINVELAAGNSMLLIET